LFAQSIGNAVNNLMGNIGIRVVPGPNINISNQQQPQNSNNVPPPPPPPNMQQSQGQNNLNRPNIPPPAFNNNPLDQL
jgi:hypothetical protein